jgi:hypothetical protein
MPTIKFLHVSYDGDDAGVLTVLKEFERMMIGDDAPAAMEPLEPIAPLSPPQSRETGNGKAPVMLICRERPGRHTLDQAAEIAGVGKQRIHNALNYAKNKGSEWAAVGEFQFKRAAPIAEPATKHPDLDGTAMPINPDRIQSGEKPTPAHIAAD